MGDKGGTKVSERWLHKISNCINALKYYPSVALDIGEMNGYVGTCLQLKPFQYHRIS